MVGIVILDYELEDRKSRVPNPVDKAERDDENVTSKVDI